MLLSPSPVSIPFSLHELVLREVGEQRAALRRADASPWALKADHETDAERREAKVAALHQWCRSNERLVLKEGLEDAVIYAGFQRLSRVRPISRRYSKLGATARRVVIFGEPDETPNLSRVDAVPITPGPLSHEWFFVVDSRRYKAALAGIDLDGFAGPLANEDRRFDAISTHHPGVVRACVDALEGAISQIRAA